MIDPVLGFGLVVLVLAMYSGKAKGAGAPPDAARDAGQPGAGPGGSPKPAPGHRTYGRPKSPESRYTIPAGWDPLRGIWISPDCEMVVEAPAFWTGLSGPPGSQTVDPNVTVALSAQTLAEVLRDPTNGAMGFVDHWAEQGLGSPEIVTKMMVELAPMCGQVPRAMWGRGLRLWYDAAVERVQRYIDNTI